MRDGVLARPLSSRRGRRCGWTGFAPAAAAAGLSPASSAVPVQLLVRNVKNTKRSEPTCRECYVVLKMLHAI